MNEFVQFVLSKLQGGIVLILLALPLLAGCMLAVHLICKKKDKVFPWKKAIPWILLSGYLLILVYVTLLRGLFMGHFINLHLFRAWREAWNNYSVKNWLNVLLNVAMFIPLGVLLPLVSTKLRKWYISIGMALGLSLVIELIQLWRGTGVCDVDDLFANTLGAVIGYASVVLIISIARKGTLDWKRGLCCGSVLLLSVGSIAGIFIAYELQEYGNIPDMASFRVNTSNTNWTLACELPDVPEDLQTYHRKPMSKEDCASFAEAFSQTFGIVFDDVQYYDEEAYFMDHGGGNGSHFLIISYLDGGYDYRGSSRNDDSWAEADRDTIVAALKKFPLVIPDKASFSADGDGWHSFTAECLMQDGYLYDGILRCRYGADGKIAVVKNHLISYKPYSQTEISIPQKAFDKLCAGDFSGGDYFEGSEPKDIRVVRAALEYRIDTRGFYRPVYVFDLVATDCDYQATVMVRADRVTSVFYRSVMP